MAQWPDTQSPGSSRPENDRTVIRRPGQGAAPAGAAPIGAQTGGGKPPPPPPPPPPPQKKAPGRSSRAGFLALAFGCLVLGGAGGWIAHLLASGAISFSPPKETALPERAEATATDAPDEQIAELPSEEESEVSEAGQQSPAEAAFANEEELNIPADPFYDMALSAVIPLAGDPVLLKDSAASRRVDLSARAVPIAADGELKSGIPAASAFVLDSRMLDDDGKLVIRAPGSEADFQFGNFGGGDESDGLVVDEQDAASDQPADLPVFLKPSTDTLDLYLSERPIGQGPSRIELRQEIAEAVSLKAYLLENGFEEEAIKPLLEFAGTEFNKSDLVAGDKIALRGIRMPNRLGRVGDYYRPVQVSIYTPDDYLGTAALSNERDGPAYVHGADPWFGKTIAQDRIDDDRKSADTRSHRLIDGLYATAVRNAVPASIVGEAIAYLAPMTDLQQPIREGERFTLVFTDVPRDDKRGGGKVLFAGVRQGNDWSVRCYVMKAPGNRGFACVSEGGKVSLSGAMLVPVKGVLTSKFGMRFHPIKKTERLHAGVDWAAPTGTPIRAAFSGKVSYRDVRGGYGNFIELSHKEGTTSRYAHMHEYADGIQLGSVVQAGDLIGYVGTTGLSTGPHLHFEIRMRGEPTDPLSFEMEAGSDAPQSVAGSDIRDYQKSITEILTVH
ncbi:M23 family metallopeptidase [Roseibium sp. AS2]|uniref:M23 family metallopeptidase n=1 Tax=Roseibium sp. AS2 TaxID=3135781 RepID=UPI003176A42C